MTIRRVLVVGSGGREHALAWRLARDPDPPEVLAAPGHEGMARLVRRLAVSESDPAALIEACRREAVDLVVVGPEGPLAAGLGDALATAGVAVFGPSRGAARLESSKSFAKEVMAAARVPTAAAETFEALEPARAALGRRAAPFVIKADGLAAGKGVCVTESRGVAEEFLAACLAGDRFGTGGRRVVIEDFLTGEEASLMAVCDGRRFALLPAARDYKRAFDGDQGPNTGGMGAWAPLPLDAGTSDEVGRRVVAPVLAEMARRGTPFRGLLYCGLMLDVRDVRVVEFNVRFGDPETQVVLPLLAGSLTTLLAGAARGALDESSVVVESGAAVAVAIVDEGYPDAVRGGGRIDGLEALHEPDVTVFHAATGRAAAGWDIRGGRAAYVMARAADRDTARSRAYRAVASLGGSGWRVRQDIAGEGPARSGSVNDMEVRRGQAH